MNNATYQLFASLYKKNGADGSLQDVPVSGEYKSLDDAMVALNAIDPRDVWRHLDQVFKGTPDRESSYVMVSVWEELGDDGSWVASSPEYPSKPVRMDPIMMKFLNKTAK